MAIVITQPGKADFLKLLVYGTSGVGKTRFLATAELDERTKPALLLDFEGGTSSIVGSTISVVRMSQMSDFNEVYDSLKKGTLKSPAGETFKTVCLDSLTEIYQRCLTEIVRGEMTGGRRKTEDRIEQQDYGMALISMRKLVRLLRDLPVHFFATALVKDEFDQREGTVRKPALPGAFAEEIGGLMDALGYLGIQKDSKEAQVRTLVLKNQQGLRAKFRVPLGINLPSEVSDPTITKILNLKEGK